MEAFKKGIFLLVTGAILAQTQAQSEGPSAYRVRIQLLEEVLIPKEKRGHEFPLSNGWHADARTRVSWGAKAMDSSSRLTRLMSPSADVLRKLIDSLPPREQKTFLYLFFSEYLISKKYRTHSMPNNNTVDYALDITDRNGRPVKLDLSSFGMDRYEFSLKHLREKWEKWLAMTEDSPFSFLSPLAKDLFFEGKMPGLESLVGENGSVFADYEDWRPIFGTPEKYVEKLTSTEGGDWELFFKSRASYARFEAMLSEIKYHSPAFGMPEWQSLTFDGDSSLKEKLVNAAKWSWALNTMDEIKQGRVVSDDILEKLNALPGELVKIGSGHEDLIKYTVELKFHRDNVRMRRFLQTALAARIISGDWSGTDGMDFTLAPAKLPHSSGSKGWDAFLLSRIGHHFIPLWNWSKAPFLSAQKKALLEERTRHYLSQLEEIETEDALETMNRVRHLTRQWIYSSDLADEMKIPLRPWRQEKNLDDVLNFRPLGFHRTRVDVNAIHLGMEYTGHFPLEGEITHVSDKTPYTRDTLGHANRHSIMQNVLKDIVREFGGDENNIFGMRGGHGHNLGYSYLGTDALGREWKVDWDGVSRHYIGTKVLKETSGEGHLELITPKFSPSGHELETIYKIFQRHNIGTLGKSVSGHLNVDLAAFEGNPRALARFLSLYHEHRGLISLLFSEKILERRAKVEVSDELAASLRDFQGSEDELKGLLYNERYFNTHFHEKTRYTDISLIDYFQDVIPEEFVSEDFDVMNTELPWRRQFKVDPGVRRMEMRLFQAPKTAFEAALQIRLVRALLSKALNEDSLLSGVVSKASSWDYFLHPEKAYADLKRLCAELKLGLCQDYYFAMVEGLNDTDMFYRFFNYHYYRNPQREKEWGSALERSRPPDQALSSHTRKWVKGEVIESCHDKMASLLSP